MLSIRVSRWLPQCVLIFACSLLAADELKGAQNAAQRSMQNRKLIIDPSHMVHPTTGRYDRHQQYGKECC